MSAMPTPENGETQNALAKAAALIAEVSFPDTPEMAEADNRAAIVGAMARNEVTVIRELLGSYQEHAEHAIDHFAPAGDVIKGGNLLRKKLQAQLRIATGLLWDEAGRTNKFGNCLLDALVLSKNDNLDEILPSTRAALAELLIPPSVQEITEAFKAEFGEDSYKSLGTLVTSTPDKALEEIAKFMIWQDTEELPYDFFIRMGWASS
jgi:hypothetical protein